MWFTLVSKLTSEQIEMLRLRYAGNKNKDIAIRMNVTESNVSQTLYFGQLKI